MPDLSEPDARIEEDVHDVEPDTSPLDGIIQQPINGQPSGLKPHKKRKLKKPILIAVGSFVGLLIIAASFAIGWYNTQLAAIGSDKNQHIVITIKSGSSPTQISQLLHAKGIIRSTFAFDVYSRLVGKRDNLQAGTYRLSPAESTPEIVDHLVKGDVDQFSITFYPGSTLKEHKAVLVAAGYTESEIDQAFAATYDSPIFKNKPVTADLEGYIYGQTYQFSTGASVSDILKRTFEEFNTVLIENDLVNAIGKQGYDLYQGITLASIVQREVNSPKSSDPSSDQKQVAQVFYSRLSSDMTLGSDVTYQYAADKMGVERDTNLDSPYNTRRYTGLPPGPISSPGLTALKAVASPATCNYLFFLSGDDDVTYFARTDAEHQVNIRDHCAIKCSTL